MTFFTPDFRLSSTSMYFRQSVPGTFTNHRTIISFLKFFLFFCSQILALHYTYNIHYFTLLHYYITYIHYLHYYIITLFLHYILTLFLNKVTLTVLFSFCLWRSGCVAACPARPVVLIIHTWQLLIILQHNKSFICKYMFMFLN